MMQAKRERDRLMKQEGGVVVNKNLYPPPASLFAPTQNSSREVTRIYTNGALPVSPKQHGSTTGAATRQHIWMSDYCQR